MSRELNSIRCVVWDLDGTLVDSGRIVLGAFRYALKPYGIRMEFEDIEKLRSAPPKRVFESVVGRKHSLAAFKRLREYSRIHNARSKLYPGIRKTIRALHSRKFKLAIWTGRPAEGAHDILNTNNLQKYFSQVVGGCMIKKNKPAPDGLRLIARNLKLKPREILMVGDHPHDIQGTLAHGSVPALALWGAHPPDEIQKFKKLSLTLQKPHELLTYFDNKEN